MTANQGTLVLYKQQRFMFAFFTRLKNIEYPSFVANGWTGAH